MYQPDETVRLEVRMGDETVWLSKQQMAELFGKDRTVISRHISNIYREGELQPNTTCAKFAHMGSDGDQSYEYTAYNLDVIISVGYRVKSKRGIQFRQWANKFQDMKNGLIVSLITLLALCGCGSDKTPRLTRAEKALIEGSGPVMRVLTIADKEDSLFLRGQCVDFSDKDLKGRYFRALAEKMVSTVTDPSEDGVGIAGPQVGIARRIVAVQRFDKDGEPFEVYPNIRIESLGGEVVPGPEGCLSVPGLRGSVPRHTWIVVSWKDPSTFKTVRDTVEGYTAVIFQHETDHLDGILYTDRADSVSAYSY